MNDVLNIKHLSYKMVVLGHYSVGKSSIVLNFVKGEFNQNEESTIGASFLTKTIFVDRSAVKYEIWDTAGQERYYSLIPMYYRGAQVALIVYDVTSEESFQSAKRWIEELKQEKPQEFLKVLVANKTDLIDLNDKPNSSENRDKNQLNNRDGSFAASKDLPDSPSRVEPSSKNIESSSKDNTGNNIAGNKARMNVEEGRALAEREKILFYETSAKTGQNINKMFTEIAKALPRGFKQTNGNMKLKKPRKNIFCC